MNLLIGFFLFYELFLIPFSARDAYQNTVTFSHDSRLVLTGGADGVLRVWNFPEMQLKSKIEVSKREIADVDVSPDRKYVRASTLDIFQSTHQSTHYKYILNQLYFFNLRLPVFLKMENVKYGHCQTEK